MVDGKLEWDSFWARSEISLIEFAVWMIFLIFGLSGSINCVDFLCFIYVFLFVYEEPKTSINLIGTIFLSLVCLVCHWLVNA